MFPTGGAASQRTINDEREGWESYADVPIVQIEIKTAAGWWP